MFDYTHKNHFKYGYNGNWFCNRKSVDDVFFCEYGVAKQQLDFRTANIEAAKLIRNSTNKPLFVMMSGGIDSEVVARSFKDANIDFTAAVLRYNDNLNKHDITYAEEWCDCNSVKIEYFDITPVKFWFSKNALNISNDSQTGIPEILCTMWMIENIKGLPIVGQGEPFVYRNDTLVFREAETIVSWYKHMINNGIEGIAGFHQYLPEQMLSILNDPLMNTIEQDSEEIKFKIYKKHYPDMKIREAYTGAEHLKNERLVAKIWFYRNKLIESFRTNEYTILYKKFIAHLTDGITDSN